jgi:hypothetical protein
LSTYSEVFICYIDIWFLTRGDEREKQGEGEATQLKDPPIEIEKPKKRKVSLQKPLTRKKTHASKT